LFNGSQQRAKFAEPFASNHPIFGGVTAKRVDQQGALANQAFAHLQTMP
jgi:hypothetical protein